MAVRKYKPTTPGRRGASVSSFDELTRNKPEKSLVAKGRNKAGRNVHGRITARHQGGGNKRRYRVIDFRRNKDGVPAKVAHIEYDPNRSARIALLHYADGEKRYIIAPEGVEAGRPADVGARRRDPRRQRAAAAQHPGRHGGARDRAEAGRGRQDGPLGGRERPADGQGGHDGDAAAALGRDAAGAGDLQGDRRRRRQRRARADPARQGGPRALAAQASVGARRRDEPGRPPAGRRRGQVLAAAGIPSSPWGKAEGRTRKKKKASNKYIVRRRGKGRS